jgi:hypothetical protein
MKTDHLEKIDELIDKLAVSMKETAWRLLNGGAVDTDKYSPEEYALAKIIVSAVAEQHAKDFYPHDPTYRAEVENLKHF